MFRAFCEKKKLSQTDLAMIIGRNRQYLYKIEKGKVLPVFSLFLL
ncbi:helix-turn-helix domain-containing protein [Chryseobacterium cucumeris]